MAIRRVPEKYALGAVLTPEEMTRYCLRYRARNAFGLMDEKEIKQTVTYAADYWRLETIDISGFEAVADPDYANRSTRAYPIVHYFNTIKGQPNCEVLDGRHRIAMARAKHKRKLLAWVGHLNEPSAEERSRRPRLPFPKVLLIERPSKGRRD